VFSIQPIPTRYAGCRFRSRLEARWAVFFNELEIKWEYEAEGYDLGPPHGWYLPDFKLVHEWPVIKGTTTYIEIKPSGLDDTEIKQALSRCITLGQKLERSTILLVGPPDINLTFSMWNWAFSLNYHPPRPLHDIQLIPTFGQWCKGAWRDVVPRAVDAARSARF